MNQVGTFITTTEVGTHVAYAYSFGKVVPLLEEFFLNTLKMAIGNRFKTKRRQSLFVINTACWHGLLCLFQNIEKL